VGIPVAIIVVGGFAYLSYVGKQQADIQIQGRGIQRGRSLANEQARQQAMARLMADDPDFNQGAFLGRVRDAFIHLQDAWCKQDLSPVRHFVSDAVYERFSLQIAEMQQRGVRNVMENVRVIDSEIAQVDADASFHTITVRLQASAKDYEVDANGKVVFGSTSSDFFSEYWTFLRRPGAKSSASGGLMEGNCPNCGAALELNEAAQCQFCGAKVRSGQYDWVLSEITQASEWRPAAHETVPGFDSIRAADPGFSLQGLEDRASVMFWRHIAAWQAGDTAPLRKMARDSCCEELAREIRPDEHGARLVPTEAAVGSVSTIGILCDEPMDQALVEVRWSCGQDKLMPDGTRRPFASAGFHLSYFILSRDHGVPTDDETSLSSAHCPGCGAPTSNSAADACEYCGTVLNQGDRDWVLDAIRPRQDRTVMELRTRLRSLPTPNAPTEPNAPVAAAAPLRGAELTAWIAYVMLVDGEVDPKEEQLLRTFAGNHGVGEQQLAQIIEAAKQGQLEVCVPNDLAEARQWLEAMAEMALADGFIAKEEQDAMIALGQHLQLTKYDVMTTIAKTRKRLYQQEKDRVRELRRNA
jgi:predicted lipid-binding transport protein (Tim44 family)/uncharacterized tellurite resistance protein B-like protein